ncbi:MAG TPA: TlpA disulfide reductase family protein [Solirubrobacteraceae bacterium]|jgi:thiol-disulfide isomerase/thioredoxin|nr:TlpA disulfide reductase family protein [Steroidobacteraceae bacterium]
MRFEQPLTTRRAFLFGCAAGLLAPAARASHLTVGAPAPATTLVTLDGRTISTGDLLGRVVVVTFWATYCSPCRTELPLLSQFATAHAPEGLTVLGFSADGEESLADVGRIARDLSFPVGLLSRSRADGYGRIWRLPVSFTIDRTGVLASDGWRDRDPVLTAARLDALVVPLLRSG